MNSPWQEEKRDIVVEMFISWLNGLKRKLRKPKNIFSYLTILLTAFILYVFFSGIYQVEEGAQALVLRLGKFNRVEYPGLHYKIPFPIEKVFICSTQKSRQLDIWHKSYNKASDLYDTCGGNTNILTSDENLMRLKCTINWHVDNIAYFILNASEPRETIKYISQSAIREVVSDSLIADVLSSKKEKISAKIQDIIQKTCDLYSNGIKIEKVQLLAAEPPAEVISAYRDVQTSKADKENLINKATAYRNKIVTEVAGEAVKMVKESEAKKKATILKAEGDVQRFTAIAKEYYQGTQATKYRIYIDAVEQILKNSKKIVVGKDSGTLKHLPLDQFLDDKEK